MPLNAFKIHECVNELRECGYDASANRIMDFISPDFDADINLYDQEYMDTFYNSLKGYVWFIKNAGFKEEGSLGLFNEGTIGAQWKWENHNAMMIEFLDENNMGLFRIGDIIENMNGKPRDEIVSWLKKNHV